MGFDHYIFDRLSYGYKTGKQRLVDLILDYSVHPIICVHIMHRESNYVS